jgi:hypothetical protein
MSRKTVSTRRSFITVAGAALSAPLAAVAGTLPAKVAEGDLLKTRLETLEDLNAIRALNRAYARHVNAGAHEQIAALFADPSDAPTDTGIHGISADGFGEDDPIEIAADRQAATACLRCTVQMEAAIGPSCPLVEMARLQGGGVVSWSEPGVFENTYVRRAGTWKFQSAIHRQALASDPRPVD